MNITPGQPCIRCARPMRPAHNRDRTLGEVPHKGRGLCRACYDHARAVPSAHSQPRGTDKEPPDWVKVDRVLHGQHQALNRAERQAVVAALDGHPARLIAQRLGIASRSVCRIRSRLRRMTDKAA